MNLVEVSNLGKKYKRKKEVGRTLKSFVLGKFFQKSQVSDFWALKDVNFEVKEGETLGIIGANGAGKSTLLSLIAETTCPTEGQVKVNGRMSSLLELGAGFHPDLTGRENIYLNASILGMSRKETENKYDAIVDLSGIPDAIDSPVKYYSSGMYVRLGFAVAVMCDPDVLLMDEVLAVGDESFRKKSLRKIEDFKKRGKTMLIVSHDLETIKTMSDRVLLLHEGTVKDLGQPISVVEHYKNFGIYQDGDIMVKDYGTKEIEISHVKFFSKGDELNELVLESGSSLTILINCEVKEAVNSPVFGIGLCDNMGQNLFGTNTQILKKSFGHLSKGNYELKIDIEKLPILRGVIYFSFAVHSQDHQKQYHRLDNCHKLTVKTVHASEGLIQMPITFNLSG